MAKSPAVTKYFCRATLPPETIADTITAKSHHHAAVIFEKTYGYPVDWVEDVDGEMGASNAGECVNCGFPILAGDEVETDIDLEEQNHRECPRE